MFPIANVWHSCFALVLEKPYTPKKKCKVTDKHTKWSAVQSKAVWKALNSTLLSQNRLWHFLLLGHTVSCSAPAAPCPRGAVQNE